LFFSGKIAADNKKIVDAGLWPWRLRRALTRGSETGFKRTASGDRAQNNNNEGILIELKK